MSTEPIPSRLPATFLRNIELWDGLLNSPVLTIADRLGRTRKTVTGAIATIAALVVRGNWASGTAYQVLDLVKQSGDWYICVEAHTSSGSFSTDLAALKWRVHKGVTTEELEARTASTKAALRSLSPPSGTPPVITVQGGLVAGDGYGGEYYWDASSTASDDGDYTLTPISSPASGRWRKSRLDDPSGWRNRACASPNSFRARLTSGKRWPRNLVVIGDSICYGYPNGVIDEAQSPVGVLKSMIADATGWSQGSWPCGGIWQRWTLAGSTSYGTKGPAGVSLILGVGATATVSGDYIDQIHVWFQRSSGAGALEVRINGTLVETINTIGTAADDVLATVNLSPRIGAGATVELKATVAAVHLTAVDISRTLAGNVPRVISHAYPGFSTVQYASAAKLASIVACNAYTVQPALYLIALGTNDAYSPSDGYHSTSADFEANLRTIVAALGIVNCVLCTPLRPGSPAALWSGSETHETYRNAVYRVARDCRIPVIDQANLDFVSTGFYQSDGVHPTVEGSAVLAAFWYEQLGLGSLVTDRAARAQALAFTNGAAAFGAPYTTPSYTIERGGIVRLHGVVNVTGLAKGTNILSIVDSATYAYNGAPWPLGQKNLIAHAWTGSAVCTVMLTVSPAGVVQMLDYSASPVQLSLDGLSYSTVA